MTSHMVRRHTHKKSIWTKHKTEDRIKKSRKIVLFSKIFWILRIQLLGRICHCTKGWLFKGLKTFSWVYFAMSVINNSASTARTHKHPLPRGVQCAEMLGTMHVTHDACTLRILQRNRYCLLMKFYQVLKFAARQQGKELCVNAKCTYPDVFHNSTKFGCLRRVSKKKIYIYFSLNPFTPV